MKERIILRSRAKALEPVVRVGKSGLSDSMVGEISKNLRKRKLIKVKLLRPSYEIMGKEKLIGLIVQKTGSELVESAGNVIVLHRE